MRVVKACLAQNKENRYGIESWPSFCGSTGRTLAREEQSRRHVMSSVTPSHRRTGEREILADVVKDQVKY